MNDKITCPKCKTKIEITEAVSAQIGDRLRQEMEAEINARKDVLDKEAQKLQKQKVAIEKAQSEVEEKIKAGVESERTKLLAQAKKKAEQDLAVDIQERDEHLKELQVKLKTAQTNELAMRKKERELQEKAESMELELAKRINEESEKVREAVKKQLAEEQVLKDAQNQEQIAGLRRQIDELKRKAEQASQQTQGEALEIMLEGALARTFTSDEIQPVGKGVHGADILQKVREPSGLDCGSILWETKNAKKWADSWLTKLREDQREAKATLAVIVTETMPPDSSVLTQMEGIWVVHRSCAIGLAMALRTGLIEVAKSRQASDGKHGKIEMVYNYLIGPEFKHRVSGIIDSLVQLQDNLNKERRAMERIWAAREKQIQSAVVNTHGMYGDLQGIFGTGLPTIEAMELPQLDVKDADGNPDKSTGMD